ncbi:hypothetical protein J2T55_001663 [Methylohalomonas lacus]|uniref:Uncharacterized protein n=1 Tax=Methylohalomonas lacus TaxID=398773 RepID=A0AAE3HJR7_9GAMM|nr:hypothetical protein [Methylohalomonas lacus]MCS3903634.1 hypothetical protein [Methylohalomonas lacus]
MNEREEQWLELRVNLLKQQQALSGRNCCWQRRALADYLRWRFD